MWGTNLLAFRLRYQTNPPLVTLAHRPSTYTRRCSADYGALADVCGRTCAWLQAGTVEQSTGALCAHSARRHRS